MKIRAGFVSNSSSASFVINKEDITAKQLTLIKNFSGGDWWEFSETDDTLEGWTTMDNYELEEYMKSIGVVNKIKWNRE